MFLFNRKVNVPPYSGLPIESHQFPAVVVVAVVVGTVVRVDVGAVVWVDAGADVNVDVVVAVVGVDLAQDESTRAAVIKQLNPSQVIFFFTLFLRFI